MERGQKQMNTNGTRWTVDSTEKGQRSFHENHSKIGIVEYPSPEAFISMASSKEMAEKNEIRLQGLSQQYLIPMKAFSSGRAILRCAPRCT